SSGLSVSVRARRRLGCLVCLIRSERAYESPARPVVMALLSALTFRSPREESPPRPSRATASEGANYSSLLPTRLPWMAAGAILRGGFGRSKPTGGPSLPASRVTRKRARYGLGRRGSPADAALSLKQTNQTI